MPNIPETIIAMLACARIGAIHSVIFAGFSAEALADRNNDAAAKLQITSDAAWRRGKPLPLKATVDEALEKSNSALRRQIEGLEQELDDPAPSPGPPAPAQKRKRELG